MKKILIILFAIVLFGCSNEHVIEKIELTERGIDVSQYQGEIDWSKVSESDISFVFIRSSMGIDGKDKCFEYNYIEAKKEGFNVGVYHYYRPNENSMQQFDNLRNVLSNKLLDFPIVIDIEVSSTIQPMDRLIIGVNKLSVAIEEEYGIKPIIYTGEYFYKDNIEGGILDNELWIANYSKHPIVDCDIWQYSDKGIVSGIKGNVDMNLIIK